MRQPLVPLPCAAALLLFAASPTVTAQSVNVPVGSAVPYFGTLDALPEAWALCDGHMVTDPASPLKGRPLPDLRGMFLRGAPTETAVGRAAGDDTVRVAPAGGHDHGGGTVAAGATAEAGRTGIGGIHRHAGQTAPAGGGFSTSGPLPGAPGGLTQRSSAHQHTLDTAVAGEHSHALPPAEAHTHGIAAASDHSHEGDNRPRHVGTWFICRVK